MRLKPCPFCGSIDPRFVSDGEGLGPYVACSNCGARVDYQDSLNHAEAAWNRRPEADVWKPCDICFNYNIDRSTEGEYREVPDGDTMLRLTFSACEKHPLFGKPHYRTKKGRLNG